MTDPKQPPALEANGVTFVYPNGVVALDRVTLRVGRGEFAAVLGANGSGKTTLLRILLGLAKPRDGEVLVDGTPAARLKPAELYRKIGMVFQNPTDQLIAPTVAEDVAFGVRNLGLPESEVAVRVQESLAAVDAASLGDRPIRQLSFGQQRRICLAGVLAMRPDVLLLDEPTAGLDPAAEAQMVETLLELNRGGATIVLCTHAIDALPVLADRVYVMREGTVACEGTPAAVMAEAAAAELAGLRLPLVAQLFGDLAKYHGVNVPQLPLTVAEARHRILELLAFRGGSP